MNLIKIGGAVLKDKDDFEKLVDILLHYSEMPLIIVVSAFHTTTKDLGKAALIAQQGNDKESNLILNQIIDKHILFAKKLLKDKTTFESLEMLFLNSKQKIQNYLKGLSITGELTLRTLDMILSFGEYFALHTVNHFLKEKGFNIKSIDATSVIVSDDNYGKAKPLIKATGRKIKEKILPLMTNDNIVIIQGFVAKNQSNEITTMGIESSNLTATILAEILNIKTITFWTDVAGLRNADPKMVANTLPIKQMNYSEAYKASVNGLKLLYPEMIDHIKKNKIEVIYRSASDPSGDFTVINSEDRKKQKLLLIQNNMVFCEKIFNSFSDKFTFNNNLELNKEIFDKVNYKIITQEKIELVFSDNNNHLLKFFMKQGIDVFKKCNIISLVNIDQEETIKIISDVQKTLQIDIFSIFISDGICSIVLSADSNEQEIVEYIHINYLAE